jgi:hypothetical protein
MSDLTINVSTNTIESGTGGIRLDPAATEIVTINQGVLLPDGTEALPAIRFADDNNTGIFSPDNDVIATTSHGKTTMKFTGVPSGENYVTVTNAVVGGIPTFGVEGPDTDIDLAFSAQGDGFIRMNAQEVRVQTNSPGGLLINGFSVVKDEDNISRLTNDAGYLTTVSAADVGLGNVDNTSDLNKPVSNATQLVLDGKVDTGANVSVLVNDAGYLTSVSAADVGLGNVDNTSDLNKPVSNATQLALNAKADLNHTHDIADVNNLQLSLDDKANVGHTHDIADVNNLQLSLDDKANLIHTHDIADINNLQLSLDDKANVGHFHDIADVNNLQASLDDKANTGHFHAISDVTGLQVELDGKAPSSIVATAESALQPGANVSELVNDAGYITSAGASAINDLTDVTITSPTADQVLTYNGTTWVNQDASPGQGGGGGGTVGTYVETPFAPVVVDRFAKGATNPFQSFETDRASIPTTAHAPSNDIIVNVHNRSNGDFQSTLTFFKVDKLAHTRSVISSDTTTLAGGNGTMWVDISETGDRVAVAMKKGALDQVIILVTTDDWLTFSIEDSIDCVPDNANNIISVALNGDGSAFFVSYGNEGGSGTLSGGIRKYTRAGSTWSFDSQVFTNTVGSRDEVCLMYGQQDDLTCGFMVCEYGTGTADYNVYQDSGGWSSIWSDARTNREKWNIPFISFDGDTILYKSGNTKVTTGIKGTQQTFDVPESSNSNSPYVMTGDGHNIMVSPNQLVIWAMHRDGTSLDEICFIDATLPWSSTGAYGKASEYSMRPSKGNTHYWFQGPQWLPYASDSLMAGIDHANWVSPGSGIGY